MIYFSLESCKIPSQQKLLCASDRPTCCFRIKYFNNPEVEIKRLSFAQYNMNNIHNYTTI